MSVKNYTIISAGSYIFHVLILRLTLLFISQINYINSEKSLVLYVKVTFSTLNVERNTGM